MIDLITPNMLITANQLLDKDYIAEDPASLFFPFDDGLHTYTSDPIGPTNKMAPALFVITLMFWTTAFRNIIFSYAELFA